MEDSAQKQITRKQHIVPQSYLRRFATLTENGNYQIGVGIRKKDGHGFSAATQSIQMAYSLTDMAWVGRIGSEAIAAVGSVGIKFLEPLLL